MNFWTIFITGLTTGGLSCLAMQGGLLTSAIANQKDEEILDNSKNTSSKKKLKQISQNPAKSFDSLDWLPVGMFLIGKLISHTILGFLLGFLGSKLELSLSLRLIFQALAAFFMLATAMNLLEMHPIFRYVVIKPPKIFNRIIRNSTKSKALFTPLIIGILTILIPCGVTQSIEVLAISSANPWIGATTMFVFVLGTSPLFAVLGIGVAKLSETWNKTFMQIAAILLILLAFSSLNGILVVKDSPITFQKITSKIFDPAGLNSNQPFDQALENNGVQKVNLSVLNSGYFPKRIRVKAGVPVEMTLTSQDAYTCAIDFVFKEFNLRQRLEPNDQKTLTFTPTKKGKFTFSCSMGMYTGVMEVI